MAEYASLVQETTETQGTLDLVLAGAVLGYRTLSAGFRDNVWVHYLVKDANGVAFERGYGLFTEPNMLSRVYVQETNESDGVFFAPDRIALTAGIHTVVIGSHPDLGIGRGYQFKSPPAMAIPDSVWTRMTWDTGDGVANTDWDTDFVWDGISTADLFIIPDWVSKVRVAAKIRFEPSAAGYRMMRLASSVGGWDPGFPEVHVPGVDQQIYQQGQAITLNSGLLDVEKDLKGNAFRVYCGQTSGGTLNLLSAEGDGWLQCEYVQ